MLPLQGQFEFDAARRQAFWNAVRTAIHGRSRTLLSYADVIAAAGNEGQADRGVRDIPLHQVRGSEGRADQFDAAFLPVKRELKARWARVDVAVQQGVIMPPIEVYQLGQTYFVKDGHNRVSVARRLGQDNIRGHVIEVRTRAPLSPGDDPIDLLLTAEYSGFLERTQLHRVRPDARVECRELGRYDVIFEHILGHRYFLGLERGYDVPLPEAAASWYDNVYLPVAEVIRDHQVAEHFAGWSTGDLYLAVTRRWLRMGEEDEPGGAAGAVDHLLTEGAAHHAGLAQAMRPWARTRRKSRLWLRAARGSARRRPRADDQVDRP